MLDKVRESKVIQKNTPSGSESKRVASLTPYAKISKKGKLRMIVEYR